MAPGYTDELTRGTTGHAYRGVQQQGNVREDELMVVAL
jgi:hypothetical protein